MKKMNMKSAVLLTLTALIWGIAFVAQSAGMDYVGPFTFSCLRNLLGAVVLLPCIKFIDYWNEKSGIPSQKPKTAEEKKVLLSGGICCGLALCVASNLQQIGIQYTSAGKAGFITALYIVLVPIFGLVLKKKVGIKVWISVVIAVMGLYFLCMTGDFSINAGDFYIFLCAIVFAIHIMVIDYFSPKVDGVRMSCIQFFVTSVLSSIPMFLFESVDMNAVFDAMIPLLYAGIMSSGVAYTLQIVGQKDADPTMASLILSLESVFSVLAGWMILKEVLSVRESVGCILMFVAIILSQLPERKKSILPF